VLQFLVVFIFYLFLMRTGGDANFSDVSLERDEEQTLF
jgi:hypothetical protein